jgi:hypothetical protein
MTTYKSYESAKIANPERDIYKFQEEFTLDSNRFGQALPICNPADHCMTVEKFLAGGHKFVDGDALLDVFGGLIVVGSEYSVLGANIKLDTDDRRYILRAAALEEEEPELTKDDSPQGILSAISNRLHNIGCEHQDSELGEELGSMACDIWGVLPLISNESIQEKKPRTKVEYVKLNVNDDGGKFWEVARDWAEGVVDFRFMRGNGDYDLIDSYDEILKLYTNRNLYRRIETTMTEREAFVEALQDIWFVDGFDSAKQFDKIVDSGLFKLVN